jgi:hypothetical protein
VWFFGCFLGIFGCFLTVFGCFENHRFHEMWTKSFETVQPEIFRSSSGLIQPFEGFSKEIFERHSKNLKQRLKVYIGILLLVSLFSLFWALKRLKKDRLKKWPIRFFNLCWFEKVCHQLALPLVEDKLREVLNTSDSDRSICELYESSLRWRKLDVVHTDQHNMGMHSSPVLFSHAHVQMCSGTIWNSNVRRDQPLPLFWDVKTFGPQKVVNQLWHPCIVPKVRAQPISLRPQGGKLSRESIPGTRRLDLGISCNREEFQHPQRNFFRIRPKRTWVRTNICMHACGEGWPHTKSLKQPSWKIVSFLQGVLEKMCMYIQLRVCVDFSWRLPWYLFFPFLSTYLTVV